MYSSIVFWLLLAITSFLLRPAQMTQPYEVLFNSINTSYNTELIRFVNHSISPNKKSFSTMIDIQKGWHHYNGKLIVNIGTEQSHWNLVNEQFDFCKFVANPQISPITNVLYVQLVASSHTTLDISCPVQPSLLDFRNMRIDMSKLLPTTPEIDYFATFFMGTQKNELIFKFKVSGCLKKLAKRQQKRRPRTLSVD